jgi:hypothetical protein
VHGFDSSILIFHHGISKKKKKEVREAHTWAVEDERKSGSKEK